MFPESVSKLILEDPIGLEDYRIYIPIKCSKVYNGLLNQKLENIKEYHKTYYTNLKKSNEIYPVIQYRLTLQENIPALLLQMH